MKFLKKYIKNKERKKRIIEFLKECHFRIKDFKMTDSEDLKVKCFFMDLYEYFGLDWN